MKIGVVIQARFASTRLPGKILKKLPKGSDTTVLQQVIRRLKRSGKLDDFVVATTNEEEAAAIVAVAKTEGIKFFRGSTEDVLSRCYHTACENSFDIVVRVTSDCPCVDPEMVDLIIEKHLKTKADYTSNTLERTYPLGLDAEAINLRSLGVAHKNAKKDYEREHVTPYIYQNPGIFKIEQVKAPEELYAPDIRITLDTIEDYDLLCEVFNRLYPDREFFNAQDIVTLFKNNPELASINKGVVQKGI